MKLNISKILLLSFLLLINSCVLEPAAEYRNRPNHIRTMFKNDPSTTVVIGWNRYHTKKSSSKIYWDTVDHGEDIEAYANEMEPQKYSNYFGIKSAFVELTDLEPQTRYYFIIKNSLGKSKRYFVETLPNNRDARISLIAGGDSRNNRTPRKAANTLVAKLKPHAVLFGGDMVNTGSPGEWHKWFNDWQRSHGEDGRVTPIIAARGNHEISNKILKALFWLPNKNYYALSIADGLIRTYVLNSEMSMGGNQLTWLKKDLEENQDIVWKMAQYHRPMRPHVAKKSEGTNQYKYWAPLFYEHQVKLVIESDSHTVKSTWPVRPSTEEGSDQGFVRDDANGTTFVGEGCWGAPLRASNDTKEWTRDSGSFNQFKLIFVDQNKIELRTIKVDNADEVAEIDIENRFELPENLDVWNPSEGDVITIE